MTTPAATLADWATSLDPSDDDLALARRSLLDTVAVTYAAREHPLRPVFKELSNVGQWAATAHVLDFDDLHMASTTHISAVCVPVALASGGGARAYLAGAGVMARLGTALGWRHYTAGWHATCTAGAPAAAVAASVARNLDAHRTATAIALALPAAGGVQRAFGTAAKSLQVAFAAEAGVRAARLADAGATADPRALDEWMRLVGGDPATLAETTNEGPAVPGGLAIKLFPCCYALQRPIAAVVELAPVAADEIDLIRVRTPTSSLEPLIHKAPHTGLEGKFSLEYGVAVALLDRRPDFASFEDDAVSRPEAQRLVELVEIETTTRGDGLLDGEVEVEVSLNGTTRRATLKLPPGAPDRPPTDDELRQKLEACAPEKADEIARLTWADAADFLRANL
jgi:2-methylcitrate dehydratase PrpD